MQSETSRVIDIATYQQWTPAERVARRNGTLRRLTNEIALAAIRADPPPRDQVDEPSLAAYIDAPRIFIASRELSDFELRLVAFVCAVRHICGIDSWGCTRSRLRQIIATMGPDPEGELERALGTART